MQTMAFSVLLLMGVAGAHAAARRGFLSGLAHLRPDVVAMSLAKVEDDWRKQATDFADCNAPGDAAASDACTSAPKAFERSCSTVVSAVLQASSGDRAVVMEYMDDICSEPQLTGWKKEHCQGFAKAISDGMTADSYDNRERLDINGLCMHFWMSFSTNEGARVRKERDERLVQERKAEAERAAAAKKEEEEAKQAIAEKRRRAQEDAARQAEEAKQKAQDASEKLRQQQEEQSAQQSTENSTRASTSAEVETKAEGTAGAAPANGTVRASPEPTATPAEAAFVNAPTPVDTIVPVDAAAPVNARVPVNATFPVNATVPLTAMLPVNGTVPVHTNVSVNVTANSKL